VKVRITKKFAEFIDGVDLTDSRVGDVIDVPVTDASLLLAERWAVPANDITQRVEAADSGQGAAEPDSAARPKTDESS